VLSRNGVEGIAAIDPQLVPRTRFVHNPYVSEEMLAGGAAREETSGPPLIVSVGRLSAQKNQAMLLDALARLRERPWWLVVLGEGLEEARLRAQAEALGLAERVEFAGFQDPVPYYKRAALLALPSRWEDLPATMVEALACGCPVVATASSEAVVHFLGELGIDTVPVGDVAAFAAAVERALDETRQIEIADIASYGIAAGVEEHLEALRPFL
jgi:glycosyltransferase involved in cell wall biosynthesis